MQKQATLVVEEDHVDDQFTYPPKLQGLFEDDDDEEYPLPFNDPDDLMNIFSDLEEKNLSLIEQGQEHDELLEKKRKDFYWIRNVLENDIDILKKSEIEVKERTGKTQSEKETLERMTSEGNIRILSDGSYKRVKETVSQIKALVDKNKT